MSLNLRVPKDSPKKIPRRAKSPGKIKRSKQRSYFCILNFVFFKGAVGPICRDVRANPRAKSKSPNPSFCSVLSRVKDWELGAFTPKTALVDNVADAWHIKSNLLSSDESDVSLNKVTKNLGLQWPSGSMYILAI